MPKPLISFVVPVYNAANYLQHCFDSLLRQTFSDIEIICVDDGSTDGSAELCDLYALKNPCIHVIHQQNQGVSAARNNGIQQTQGKFIAFVDADDWVDFNVCEVFVDALKSVDYDLFCFSAVYHGKKELSTFLFENDEIFLSQQQKNEFHCKVMSPWAPWYESNCSTRFAGSACGKFYRSEILKKNKIFFSTKTVISEDVLFNTLSLDFFKKIGYTRKTFYHYRVQKGSAQNRYRPNSMMYFGTVIDEIQNWLSKTKKNQLYRDCANTLFVHYLFGALKEDYFHKDNPDKKIARLELCQILDKDEIRDILNNANYTYFSKVERMLVELLQKRKVRLIECLLKVYNALVRS